MIIYKLNSIITHTTRNNPFWDSNTIKYELIDENSIQLNIFFDKKNLNLKGWETTDSYANKVKFLIKNIETNILIKETIFKIPRQEDL